jgi:hypothetical protein
MLLVQEEHGIRRGFRAVYRSDFGRNGECGTCGSAGKEAAPDFLLRQHKGWVWTFALALARKRYHRRKEGACMTQAHDYAIQLAKLPDRIAAIVSKTATCEGDAFHLTDDEALGRIFDLLQGLDESLIERNSSKRLPPRKR